MTPVLMEQSWSKLFCSVMTVRLVIAMEQKGCSMSYASRRTSAHDGCFPTAWWL
jgi:hypothetical protein